MQVKPLAVALRFLAFAYALTWLGSTLISGEAIAQPESEWSTFQAIVVLYTFLPIAFVMLIAAGLGICAGLVASGLWIFTGKVEWPFKKQKEEGN